MVSAKNMWSLCAAAWALHATGAGATQAKTANVLGIHPTTAMRTAARMAALPATAAARARRTGIARAPIMLAASIPRKWPVPIDRPALASASQLVVILLSFLLRRRKGYCGKHTATDQTLW